MKLNNIYSLTLFILIFTNTVHSWSFIEKSTDVSLSYFHGYDQNVEINASQIIVGGIAIGDINGDGWDDIFAVTGETKDQNGANINPNKLFISQKDGTFRESAIEFNINPNNFQSSAPLIIDINNDGRRDLIFGSVDELSKVSVYLNQGNNSFVEINSQFPNLPTFGISAADTDKDGDLDLFFSHWILNSFNAFWGNDGNGNFTDITSSMIDSDNYINSFTPIFADVNNDNWVDLLLTSDFSSSQYFLNNGSGSLIKAQTNSINDENGMGSAVGDYDNDGDLDWFVTAIYDEDGTVAPQHWGETGNRLYQNNGNGVFQDVSLQANVYNGFWGWGTCFADFNNDMYLDIFQVNGFQNALDFINDPSRLFLNNQDGTFTEISSSLNLVDSGMGRAISCYDNDRDGDIDILINNNQQGSKFYQNNLDNQFNYITIKLVQDYKNIDAIGAKIQVKTNSTSQIRQILSGGAFSAIPTAQHFGLAENTIIEEIKITWPDNTIQILNNISANQYLIINKPFTISGTIKDIKSQQPLKNIQVLAYSNEGILLTSTYSDSDGNYFLNDLSPNNYHLVTNHSDFINQAYPSINCGISVCSPELSNMITVTNNNIYNIDFNLQSSRNYYPNLTGIWHNETQSGHGIQVEVIKAAQSGSPTLYATWYVNNNGKPMWLTGIGELNKGIATVNLYITNNSSFPPNFNSSDITSEFWGTLNFQFDSLTTAHINWNTNYSGFSNSSLDLIKITSPSNFVTTEDIIDSCLSGSFYNPNQSGHGIVIEVLGDLADRLLLTWFTYDTQNNQFWLLANGNTHNNQASLSSIFVTNNNFPPSFDTVQNIVNDWGNLTLIKNDNDNITLTWKPNNNFSYFGEGSIEMTRLTSVKGLENSGCN